MNREFSVSTWDKIFHFILALVTLALSVFMWVALGPINSIAFVFGLFLAALAILIVIATLKRKIRLYDDRIVHTNLFRTRELFFIDIKGYRIGQRVLYIIPNDSSYHKITINNYIDYTGSDELKKWLRGSFTDLDQIDYQTDLSSIMNDSRLGVTESDRKSVINNARITAAIYNLIGGVFIIMLFVLEKSKLFDALLILYPLIAIVIIMTSKGLVKFFAKPRSPYYTVSLGVYCAIIPLFIKSINDYSLLELNHFWLPYIIAALLLGTLFTFSAEHKESTTEGTPLTLGRLLTGLLYAFCCVILINCAFDNSTDKLFQAKVLGHHITYNKRAHYHIFISSWGAQSSAGNIDVSKAEYYQDTVGSIVNVHLKKGLLSIPWYTISK